MTTTTTTTLDTFLNNWYQMAHDYYVETAIETKAKYSQLCDQLRKAERDHMHERVSEEVVELRRELNNIKKYTAKLAYGLMPYVRESQLTENGERELDKVLRREVERKREQFIARVEACVGEITDMSYLTIGEGGNIDGVAEGVNGKCSVRTIGAGGYNIQRFHYRVLVKRIA